MANVVGDEVLVFLCHGPYSKDGGSQLLHDVGVYLVIWRGFILPRVGLIFVI